MNRMSFFGTTMFDVTEYRVDYKDRNVWFKPQGRMRSFADFYSQVFGTAFIYTIMTSLLVAPIIFFVTGDPKTLIDAFISLYLLYSGFFFIFTLIYRLYPSKTLTRLQMCFETPWVAPYLKSGSKYLTLNGNKKVVIRWDFYWKLDIKAFGEAKGYLNTITYKESRINKRYWIMKITFDKPVNGAICLNYKRGEIKSIKKF